MDIYLHFQKLQLDFVILFYTSTLTNIFFLNIVNLHLQFEKK
jgi:hypothetical protein